MTTTPITYAEVEQQSHRIAARWVAPAADIACVHGVPSGGAPLAQMVAGHLGVAVADVQEAQATTCALRGILLHGDAARAEFMAHHHNRAA